VLIATGSEVALAVEIAKSLEAQGVGADVVSMVSTNLFDEQPASYQADILGDGGEPTLRVSIEAGTTFGWERYTGRGGLRFGIDSFGASAPIDALYDHFGLTEAKITPKILAALG
jgi:transketolase